MAQKNINVTAASQEFDKVQQYRLTMGSGIKSIKDLPDETIINVTGWLEYDVTDERGTKHLLSLMDDENHIYATVSQTFTDEFHAMESIMGELPISIMKLSGTTKAGRQYVTCTFYVEG